MTRVSVNKASLIITTLTFFLTAIALATPFWLVHKVKDTGEVVAEGVIYTRTCTNDTCHFETEVNRLDSVPARGPSIRRTFYYQFASKVLNAVVPLLLMLAVIALQVWSLRKGAWNDAINCTCIILISWAAILQMELLGPYANDNVAKRLEKDTDDIYYIPTSLVLWGIASFFNSGTCMLHIVVFIKNFFIPSVRSYTMQVNGYQPDTNVL